MRRAPSVGSSSSTSARSAGTPRQAQTGRDHLRLVHDQQVAGAEQLGELADSPVFGGSRTAIDEQPRRVSWLDRHLGDPVGRQLVVELVQPHAGTRYDGSSSLRTVCQDAPVTATKTISVPCDIGSMNMHVWVPEAGSGPGLVLIQEIFGVGAYIRAVAERLAAAGYVVGAPDVFWRFAPGWEQGHDEAGLTASIEAMGKLDMGSAVADCVAAVSTLAELEEVSGTPGVIGFCLGGTLAYAVAVNDEPSVCVSYYGSGVPSMLDQIDHVTCPTLFHFGECRRLHPQRRRGCRRPGARRSSGLRAQRRGRRPRVRQPRELDVLQRIGGQGGVVEDDGVPG